MEAVDSAETNTCSACCIVDSIDSEAVIMSFGDSNVSQIQIDATVF
jgi:hypothetical protein